MPTNVTCLNHYYLYIISVFLLGACDSGKSTSQNESEVPVRSAKLIEIAGPTNSADYLSYPAVIQSAQLSELSFEVGGVLKELNVVEAQRVVKGEILAKLDQRDLQTQLKSARAESENASAEYQRALRLIGDNSISQSEVESRKSQRDVKDSKLESAEKALQDSILVAPYSGAIAKISGKFCEIHDRYFVVIAYIDQGRTFIPSDR